MNDSPDMAATKCLIECLKDAHRHLEELYKQADQGTIVTAGLETAQAFAATLRQKIVQNCSRPWSQ